ncbi:hypothetical protein [Sorangium sp. So ce1000]|uniref:hypothetical protein n=1 Tax=Sorangium sp. So ce1000 TaxID=3133325 RepID=UPI003F618565
MSSFRASAMLPLLLIAANQGGCVPLDAGSDAVFDRTALHEIAITVDDAHLEQLATDLDERVSCTVVYDGEVVSGAGIRQKGNALEELSGKPSFSLKLDAFDDEANLHGLAALRRSRAPMPQTEPRWHRIKPQLELAWHAAGSSGASALQPR